MFEYNAIITWNRGSDEVFTDRKYNRKHEWEFDQGLKMDASPSEHIVPLPHADPSVIDPEQAFVAAVSSCHMLTFLDQCAQAGVCVDSYEDNAVGILKRVSRGKMAVTKVTLRVKASYCGKNIPDQKMLEDLHHKAHEFCFIANSVTTEIVTEIIS